MIGKLKRKFVLIAMLSVAIVLTLLMGVVNTVNYLNVIRSAEDRIDYLTSNRESEQPPAPPEGETLQENETRQEPDGTPRTPFENGRQPWTATGGLRLFGNRFDLNAEAHFDSRYFTATVSPAGEVTATELSRIYAVDESEAAEMALAACADGRTSGFTERYRFRATQTEEGTSYLFLDCSRELDTFYSFLSATVLVGAAGMLLILALVVLFSGAAVRPMAESHEKQKRFITDASHELKTPLAVISADAEVLELTEGENEWTESIKNQVRRLTSLTEKLVMLSRMDEEAYKPVMTDFDLSAAVTEIAASFESVAVSKNRRYETGIAPDVRMHGDEAAVRQLCSLLIDNAMKYSDEGGAVRVTLKKNGKLRELTVWNTVTEISKGKHEELFERFYRADASRASRTGGHGIGLSVAKAIVLSHKGKISAVSDDGGSLRFTCVF